MIDVESGGHDDSTHDNETISTLKDIFTGKEPAEIEHAIMMSHGSINVAADQLLGYSESTDSIDQFISTTEYKTIVNRNSVKCKHFENSI